MLRLQSSATYMRMSPLHRRLYDAGLPRMAMGNSLRDLTFRSYRVGPEISMAMTTATDQQLSLTELCAVAAPGGQDIAGTFVIYSEGAIEPAMVCAGVLFEQLFNAYGGRCLAVDELRDDPRSIPPVGVYLIYGISDQMHPHDAAAVRNYRYKHDGSLFLLVASSLETTVDDLMHKTLRIHDARLVAVAGVVPGYEIAREV